MDWMHSITQTHTHYEDIDIPNVDCMQEISDDTSRWVEKYNIDYIMLEWLFAYNRWWFKLGEFWKTVYSSNPVIQMITFSIYTTISSLYTFVSRWIYSRKSVYTEPTTNWINIVSLYKESTLCENPHDVFDTSAVFTMDEQYDEFAYLDRNNTHSNNELAGLFGKAYRSASRILVNQPTIAEIAIWSNSQSQQQQIVRVWTSYLSDPPSLNESIEYSNVKLLYVEYSHPKMNGVTIEFVIPKSLLLIGNELFSAAFIYRWLNYFNDVWFVFDENYTLNIMDDDIHQYALHYGDYIVLDKNDLMVISNINDHFIKDIRGNSSTNNSDADDNALYQEDELVIVDSVCLAE